MEERGPGTRQVERELTAAERFQIAAGNLERIAQAFDRYHNEHGAYPPAAITIAGRKLLSWRVTLLPYLGYEQLYRQFRLNEPWNSAHNRKLLPLIPDVYRLPGSQTDRTHCLAVVGESYALRWQHGRLADEFTDGAENTAMLVEVPEKLAVPWTQPADFEPSYPLPALGCLRDDGFLVLWASGNVGWIRSSTPQHLLKAMLTRDAGESFFAVDVHVDPEEVVKTLHPGISQ
ncbi:MAG: hypothetical protein KatS3mg110_2854 [Pirellulaceae bacterium]|nr:MAG: hypothetical protein KatS3mg110_2854 [Pirellulaceae bacterium]